MSAADGSTAAGTITPAQLREAAEIFSQLDIEVDWLADEAANTSILLALAADALAAVERERDALRAALDSAGVYLHIADSGYPPHRAADIVGGSMTTDPAVTQRVPDPAALAMTATQLVAELAALDAQATPAPWAYSTTRLAEDAFQEIGPLIDGEIDWSEEVAATTNDCIANAECIVSTRNALPRILAVLRCLPAWAAELERLARIDAVLADVMACYADDDITTAEWVVDALRRGLAARPAGAQDEAGTA